jgi:hypothetical protein
MGELSKTLGELGERKVSYLMELVGWVPFSENETIICVNGIEHTEKVEPKTTHGIDALYRYPCPLVNGALTFVLVSSKNQGGYSAKPSIAKKYVLDLVNTIECFQNSDLRKNISRAYGLERKYMGVLFWLSDDGNDDSVSLINKFANEAMIDSKKGFFHCISLIDNGKANFLFNCITYVKRSYDEYQYYYHNTGYNSSPLNRVSTGSFLPVEIVNSGLILFKAVKNQTVYLVVGTSEKYSG